jgi:hypothetical protein
VENKGIFPLHLLNKIGYLVRENVARIVERPSYMTVITSLVIPGKTHKHLNGRIKIINRKKIKYESKLERGAYVSD